MCVCAYVFVGLVGFFCGDGGCFFFFSCLGGPGQLLVFLFTATSVTIYVEKNPTFLSVYCKFSFLANNFVVV